jgi:hypothetical protein
MKMVLNQLGIDELKQGFGGRVTKFLEESISLREKEVKV